MIHLMNRTSQLKYCIGSQIIHYGAGRGNNAPGYEILLIIPHGTLSRIFYYRERRNDKLRNLQDQIEKSGTAVEQPNLWIMSK